MLRPLSLLPALVAVVATTVALAPPATAGRSAAPATPQDPLEVTISSLTPSYLPEKGPIRITGSLTNRSADPFTAINLHAFVSDAPITTSAELTEAVDLDPAEFVGERITTPGTFGHVDELAPGASTQFSIRVPRKEIEVSAPGVYWFGVHALGDSVEPRDDTADGRARTFLPLLPDDQPPVDTALVIPLRREVRYAGDGSIADVEGWAESLSNGGVLRTLVDFGASAGSRSVNWLVDPAVPDTVRSLVAGNPPRSLDDTVPAGEPGDGESPTDGATAEPSESESPDAEQDDEEEPAPNPATEPGVAWLDKMQDAMAGDEILALPYGDVDVSAAAEQDPDTYIRARRRSGRTLDPGGFTTTPAVSSPSGYVDPNALPEVRANSTILVTDRMFPDGAPPLARVGGRRLTPTSWTAEEGGPGPGDPLSAVALRQQILSEAAVRSMDPERPPLVVVMPQKWNPGSTLGFFGGLDVPWLNLVDLSAVTSRRGIGVEAEELQYPSTQVRRELDAGNFDAAEALTGAGETLQNVLTRNDTVAATVADESLTTVSYAARAHPEAARANADRSADWISGQLGSIEVDAPRAVTLASSSGRFAATITNRLDHPVTVQITPVSEQPLTIDAPESIDIAADSSASVLLGAATDRLGVHNVELIVTDEAGTPLGSSDELPIRSVQVSQVIWLILGTGVALLFGTILLRLVRRVRKARA